MKKYRQYGADINLHLYYNTQKRCCQDVFYGIRIYRYNYYTSNYSDIQVFSVIYVINMQQAVAAHLRRNRHTVCSRQLPPSHRVYLRLSVTSVHLTLPTLRILYTEASPFCRPTVAVPTEYLPVRASYLYTCTSSPSFIPLILRLDQK